MLAAGVLGGVLGWRDNAFMVPEGSTRAVGRETGLVVRNEGFTDEYFPSGTAKDYRSDLVVLQDGKEVARKTIRVNDPLDVAGVRFHQAFFGPAAVMRVRDPQGNVIFEDGVALGYQFDGTGIPRNGGFFVLGNRQMAVYVLVPAAQRGPDPEIPAGNVRLEIFLPRQARPSAVETLPQGTPREVLGYTFEFVRERQFSGLQVVAQSGDEPDLVRRGVHAAGGAGGVQLPPAPGVGADGAGPWGRPPAPGFGQQPGRPLRPGVRGPGPDRGPGGDGPGAGDGAAGAGRGKGLRPARPAHPVQSRVAVHALH